MPSLSDSNSSINDSYLKIPSTARRETPYWILNEPKSYTIPYTICYSLILVLSVVGNTSIIAIVARNPSMRSTINYLIANMAVTDLVSSVVVISHYFSIVHNMSYEMEVPGVLGTIFCKLVPYIRGVSISVSIYSMVAIAFDRFFAVVFPMRATPRLLDIRVLLPAIWFSSLVIFSVYLMNYKLISTQGVDLCDRIWPFGLDRKRSQIVFYCIKLVLLFLIPLVNVAILYTVIAIRMRRQRIPGEQSSNAEIRRRKRNNNILKMAVVIVFFFFLCWVPYQILSFIKIVVWQGKAPNSVASYLYILSHSFNLISYMSLAINPYICFGFSSNYRKCVKSLFPFSYFFVNRVCPVTQ